MRLLKWVSRSATLNDRVGDGEIRDLTDQFYVTQRAYFAKVHAANDGHGSSLALQRAQELLRPDRPPTWGEAYEVEQMLVHLMDDETLRTELDVRQLEAKSTLRPQLADFYAKQLASATKGERRRTLMARLLNDLQWRYTVNEVKRRYSKDITSRTGILFIAAMALFGLWIAYLVFTTATTSAEYADLRLLILAGLAGTWGATFSMLAGLKGRLENSELDDLKLVRPWVMLTSRAIIGTGAGSVLYFFLRSGLLGGSAFPNLVDTISSAPGRDLALLIVWCFIAGFSEKFVPSLLDKTEVRTTASSETDRRRPGPNGARPIITDSNELQRQSAPVPREDTPEPIGQQAKSGETEAKEVYT